MGRSLQEVLDALPEDEKQKVYERSRVLIQEVRAVGQLRRLLDISQQQMAERLDVSQPAVSQLENQGDILLSTLRSYVEALGGSLELVVTLPGRSPIKLSELTGSIGKS